jgi:hypothetical protein
MKVRGPLLALLSMLLMLPGVTSVSAQSNGGEDCGLIPCAEARAAANGEPQDRDDSLAQSDRDEQDVPVVLPPRPGSGVPGDPSGELLREAGIGLLDVTSGPTAAEVWLDGKRTGRLTPIFSWNIPAGTHRLRAENAFFTGEELPVAITAGRRITIDLPVHERQAYLTIRAAHPGLWSFRGKEQYFPMERAPIEAVGGEIRFTAMGREPRTEAIGRLQDSVNILFDIDLKPMSPWKAAARSLLFPGTGQLYQARESSSKIWSSTALASLSWVAVAWLAHARDWSGPASTRYAALYAAGAVWTPKPRGCVPLPSGSRAAQGLSGHGQQPPVDQRSSTINALRSGERLAQVGVAKGCVYHRILHLRKIEVRRLRTAAKKRNGASRIALFCR